MPRLRRSYSPEYRVEAAHRVIDANRRYRHTYATKSELIAAVDNWMYFYNHQRRHSAIGMRSPIDYERSLTAATEAS